MHYISGNSSAYFSLTGTIEEQRYGIWGDHRGGCLHEEISKHFPELIPYIRWHLTGWDGPMHYAANAAYWWMLYLQASGKIPLYESSSALNTSVYRPEEGHTSEKLLEYFKHTTVFGALPDDILPAFPVPYRTQRVGSEVKEVPMCEPRKLIDKKIADWCFERKDRLMELFKSDMVKLLGEEVTADYVNEDRNE